LNYFNYLKICNSKGNLLFRTDEQILAICSTYYLNYRIFRTTICEYIYDGINSFPGISRFIISCTNNTGTTKIVIGLFEELDDSESNCLMIIKDCDTDEVLTLNKKDIKNMYTFNRNPNAEVYDVNIFMSMLIRGGDIPKIFVHEIPLKGVVYNKDGTY